MIVVELTARSFHRITELGRTAHPLPWVDAVEEFVGSDLVAQVGAARGSRVVAVLDDDGSLLAVAAHRPHDRFTAEHLQAFVVAVDRRGRGKGEPAFRCVLAHVVAESQHDFVIWHVQRDNAPMLALSVKVGDRVNVDDDYVIFAYP